MVHVAKNLKAQRQKLGWNQHQLAQKLGISVPAVSKIETGATDITINRLSDLADIFNISPIELMLQPGVKWGIQEEQLDAQKKLVDISNQEIASLQRRLISLFDEVRQLESKLKKITRP